MMTKYFFIKNSSKFRRGWPNRVCDYSVDDVELLFIIIIILHRKTVIQPWWNRLRDSKRGKDTSQNHKITSSIDRLLSFVWSWGSQLPHRTGVYFRSYLLFYYPIIDHSLLKSLLLLFISSIDASIIHTTFDPPWCLFILFLIIAFPYSLMDKKGISGRSPVSGCCVWFARWRDREGGLWTASSFSSCYAETSSDWYWWWGPSNQEATSGIKEKGLTKKGPTKEASSKEASSKGRSKSHACVGWYGR